MNKLNIEYIDIDEIKPYENNAKIHTPEQIEQIKKSIEEFGFNDPIALWHDEIVEGHGRILAAKEMGIEKIPVIRLDHLSDEERRAYMLVHNKLTMNTGFDFEKLDIELESITNIDMSEYDFDASHSLNLSDDLFTDAEEKQKEPKKIQCPKCGEWIEI